MNVIKAMDLQLLEQHLPSMPWFVHKYIDHKLPDLSPSTLLEYVRDFQLFFSWMIEESLSPARLPKDLTLEHLELLYVENIDAFKTFLKVKKNNTATTRERKIASLKSLFYYMSQIAEDEFHYPLLKRNVMAKIETKRMSRPELTAARLQGKLLDNEKEIKQFLLFVQHGYHQSIQKNKQALFYYRQNAVRDAAIISLILSSGLRVSEVVNLNVEDIDMNQKLAFVYRKGSLDETSQQGVYFAEMGKTNMNQYLQVRDEMYKPIKKEKALFLTIPRGQNEGKRMTRRAIQEMVQKYAAAFGKPHLTVHKLRHSFATNYYLKNDIYKTQKQLGHQSTDTTQLYAQLTDKTMAKAINKL